MDENKQPSDNGLGEPVLPVHEGEVLRDGAAPGQEQAQQTAGLAPLLSMLFDGISSFIAGRKGEHWKASPEESRNFGEAADKVAALYMDGEQPSPWLGLMLVVGVYAAPRAVMDAHMKKQAESDDTNKKPD